MGIINFFQDNRWRPMRLKKTNRIRTEMVTRVGIFLFCLSLVTGLLAQEPTSRWRIQLVIKGSQGEDPGVLTLLFHHMRLGMNFEAKTDPKGNATIELPEGPYEVTIQRKEGVISKKRLWVRPEPDRIIQWSVDFHSGDTVLKEVDTSGGMEKESEPQQGKAKQPPATPKTKPLQDHAVQELKVVTPNDETRETSNKKDTKNPRVIFREALEQARRGQYEIAREKWKQLLEMEPDNLTVAFNLGLVYLKENQCDQAFPYLESVFHKHPSWMPVIMALAECSARLRRWPDAVSYYQKLVTIDPQNAILWFNLGISAFHAGDAGTARDAFRRVLEMAPDSTESRLARELLKRLDRET